jgi:hypothetical protein
MIDHLPSLPSGRDVLAWMMGMDRAQGTRVIARAPQINGVSA